MAMTLFTELERDWRRLAHCNRSSRVLNEWKPQHPALQPFRNLGELITFVELRGQPAANDQVHLALVELGATDQLAARTMLRAVEPGLVALAMRLRPAFGDSDEAASTVVAAAYEKIRTYPLSRRPARVAANVLLDTRQAVSRALFRNRVHTVDRPTWSDEGSVRPADEDPAVELRLLLGRAVRAGAVSERDLELVLLTRVVGVSMREVADTDGDPIAVLHQRRRRAEQAVESCARAKHVGRLGPAPLAGAGGVTS